ncbi:WRKY transcription factor 23-like [Vicia villosa]|uniref:WRKY transcription factor 23-like n=1 Tax=Vicia villosa TaxID=3911 RepID=UPI00273C0AA4|nr:WRKY transcription factor 23-like [Vicia villosa]XP_058736314.1 WRKY transcription factor 23-like [Vicia villosa]
MELLGLENYSSLLDVPQLSTMSAMSHHQTTVKSSSDTYTGKDCSEVLNQLPQTPNSCSISSASSEAVNDEQCSKTLVDQVQENEDEEEKLKTSKQLKTKKTNQKRQREPRFAFMTKSEVDHLEDGYRWRKYGQKAVKNSPFPRSYYRGTTVSCNVKKRVERSYTDPTIVVITYEGQHIHPSPAMSRSAFAGVQIPPPTAVSGGFPTNFGSILQGNYLSQYQQQQHHHQHQQLLVNTLSSLSNPYNYNSSAFTQERKLCNPGATTSFLRDHGLLQDVVPSHMLKEE